MYTRARDHIAVRVAVELYISVNVLNLAPMASKRRRVVYSESEDESDESVKVGECSISSFDLTSN